MLVILCPYCGVEAEETELTAGGEAHLERFGPSSSDSQFENYLFMRKNEKGVTFERWHHTYGCGKWFHAARCSMTMEIFGTYPAQTSKPPKKLISMIKKKRPEWGEGK